ncbi:hypothetical protein WMY93_033768 [Mugilogobius chulae]|uniref:Ig-like domain-containing protein n=1 Tax=Mugilogobius chulae TaxID=88201 RepID=A0AAW0MGE8_9GOBI
MSSQAPTFTQPLQSVVALEGSAATFQAQVSGSPVPERRPRCSEHPAVNATHSGRYSVRATNPTGQATSTAELLVTAETAPPVFVQRLQSATVRTGSAVRLDVRVSGIPTPTVKFYREGAEIQSSADFRIIQDQDLHSLLIREAFPEDSGSYSATASNSAGRATSTAELIAMRQFLQRKLNSDQHSVHQHSVHQTDQSGEVSKPLVLRSESDLSLFRSQKIETTVHMEAAVSLTHKTPPRVPPKPTSRSPPSAPSPALAASPAGKVAAAARQQSPSPVRHVKAPTPTPTRPLRPRQHEYANANTVRTRLTRQEHNQTAVSFSCYSREGPYAHTNTALAGGAGGGSVRALAGGAGGGCLALAGAGGGLSRSDLAGEQSAGELLMSLLPGKKKRPEWTTSATATQTDGRGGLPVEEGVIPPQSSQ